MAEQDPMEMMTGMTGADPEEENLGEDQEPQEAQDPTPSQGFMSAAEVEALLQRQSDRMMEHQTQYTQQIAQVLQPQQSAQQPQRTVMPTAQEVQKAFEEGDGNAFMDVYQRSLQAVHEANEARIAALEQAGMQRIQELSADVVKTTIPDLTKYEKEVNKMMDEYQIGGDLRSNPKVVQLFVKAARADNMEAEIAAREEAAKRQAAQRQTADPSSSRSARTGEPEEPLFSMGALQALRNAGRQPDQHAQALGYANWDEFNRASAEKYENWNERSVPAWRKRLNERRQASGRRT